MPRPMRCLAYHTAWLKVHFPAEFYAANMSVEIDDTDKLKVLINDARQFGVSFEPPDVNRGVYRFEPIDARRVRYGLGAIKGTGQGAIEAIVAARDRTDANGGPFRSIFDFCVRVDRTRVNKRAVEALVKAGAFDALHADRAAVLASLALAFEWADTQETHQSQVGLFDCGDSHAASTHEPALMAVRAAGRARTAVAREDCARLLSVRATCSSRARPRCGASPSGASPTWSTRASRCCWPAWSTELRLVNSQRGRVAIFKLDDMSETHRIGGQRRRARDHARPAARGRAAGGAGARATRSFCGRPATERAAGVGPGRCAGALRPLSGGERQRHRAAGRRRAAPVAGAACRRRTGQHDAGPAGATQHSSAPMRWPNSTSATKGASGRATRRCRAGGPLRTTGRRRSCTSRRRRRFVVPGL